VLSTLLVLGQVERENAGEDQQVVVRPSGSTPPSSGKGGSVTSSGCRHVTLALLAHAFLVGTRAKATGDGARGTRPPDQPARPAPADGARGPPAAGHPGVDVAYPARLRPGLVTMAPTPPGPRSPRTPPTTEQHLRLEY